MSGHISAWNFGSEYHTCYDVELDLNTLSPIESYIFSELSTVAARFSPYKEDHEECPNAYYTEEELRQKVIDAKYILQAPVVAQGLDSELKQIEDAGMNLALQLSFLHQTILEIFAHIRVGETEQAIDTHFEMLDKIQATLALLVHREDIGIPDRLWRFMRDFDNFQEARVFLLPKIKDGTYTF